MGGEQMADINDASADEQAKPLAAAPSVAIEEDAPSDSRAHIGVKFNPREKRYMFSFMAQGARFTFQTTLKRVNGCHMTAARICRICYHRQISENTPRDELVTLRDELYARFDQFIARGGKPSADLEDGSLVGTPVDLSTLAQAASQAPVASRQQEPAPVPEPAKEPVKDHQGTPRRAFKELVKEPATEQPVKEPPAKKAREGSRDDGAAAAAEVDEPAKKKVRHEQATPDKSPEAPAAPAGSPAAKEAPGSDAAVAVSAAEAAPLSERDEERGQEALKQLSHRLRFCLTCNEVKQDGPGHTQRKPDHVVRKMTPADALAFLGDDFDKKKEAAELRNEERGREALKQLNHRLRFCITCNEVKQDGPGHTQREPDHAVRKMTPADALAWLGDDFDKKKEDLDGQAASRLVGLRIKLQTRRFKWCFTCDKFFRDGTGHVYQKPDHDTRQLTNEEIDRVVVGDDLTGKPDTGEGEQRKEERRDKKKDKEAKKGGSKEKKDKGKELLAGFEVALAAIGSRSEGAGSGGAVAAAVDSMSSVVEKLRTEGKLEHAFCLGGRAASRTNAYMNGLYIQRKTAVHGHPTFEKVDASGAPIGSKEMRRFVSYSAPESRWKVLDKLNHAKTGFAYVEVSDKGTDPAKLGGDVHWSVYEGTESEYQVDPRVICFNPLSPPAEEAVLHEKLASFVPRKPADPAETFDCQPKTPRNSSIGLKEPLEQEQAANIQEAKFSSLLASGALNWQIELVREEGAMEGAILVEGRSEGKKNSSINGVYKLRRGLYHGASTWEKVVEDQNQTRYLFFSGTKKAWKISNSFSDKKTGFAFAKVEDKNRQPPSQQKLRWKVMDGKEEGYKKDKLVHCSDLLSTIEATGNRSGGEAKMQNGKALQDSSDSDEESSKSPDGEETDNASGKGGKGGKSSKSSSSGSGSSSEAENRRPEQRLEQTSSPRATSTAQDAATTGKGKGKAENRHPEQRLEQTSSPLAKSTAQDTATTGKGKGKARPITGLQLGAELGAWSDGRRRRGKVVAKMLVKGGLRCPCHFQYLAHCPNMKK